ncbi:hypothetical protein KC887_09305, partial [Candidatus Kaiserbacteria bacterium]|nr:hypothetical protein [Candidatus Kaiserbacteria bacterium]
MAPGYALEKDTARRVLRATKLVEGQANYGGPVANNPRHPRRGGSGGALRIARAKRFILPDFAGEVFFNDEVDDDVATFTNRTGQVCWTGSPVLVDDSTQSIVATQSAIVIRGVATVDRPTSIHHFVFPEHDGEGAPGLAENRPDAFYFSVYQTFVKLDDSHLLLPQVLSGQRVTFVSHGEWIDYGGDFYPAIRPVQIARPARDRERDDWVLAKPTDLLVEAQLALMREGDTVFWGVPPGDGAQGVPGPPGDATGVCVLGTPRDAVDHDDPQFTLTVSSVEYGDETATEVQVANNHNERYETTRQLLVWTENAGGVYRTVQPPGTILAGHVTADTKADPFTLTKDETIFGSEHAATVTVANPGGWAIRTTDKIKVARRRGANTYVIVGPPLHQGLVRVKGAAAISSRRASSIAINAPSVVGGVLRDDLTLPASITAVVPPNALMDIVSGGEVYAIFDETAGGTVATKWNAGDAANWHWVARGRVGFDSAVRKKLISDGNTEASIKWEDDLPTNGVTDTVT